MTVVGRHRAQWGPAALLALAAAVAGAGAPVAASEDPTSVWQRRLAGIESRVGRLSAGDAAGREALAGELAMLRADLTQWLTDHPKAGEGGPPWLEPAGPTASVEDLAAEIGRLRAVLSRIRAAIDAGPDSGAFYLGRVDVAVSAEVRASATTEMTPAGATVLAPEAIQASDRTTLSSALALAPGVTFTRIGQRNETTVYVRGFDMRQVPLFIDGIPIYTPYDGYVDLERFTTFDLAELRVSKGFTSVLYGANTLGGAINLVSKRPAARFEGQAGAGFVSGPLWNSYLNAGSRMASWYLQGNASYLSADTFPLPGGFTEVASQDPGDRLNADKRDSRFGLTLGWTPRDGHDYAIAYAGQRGEKGNPPYAGTDLAVRIRYWRWPYWDKDSVYFVSNTRIGGSSYLRGRAFYDTYDNALHSYDDATYTTQARPSSFRSLYHDTAAGASVEWGASIGAHTLRAAGHVKRDTHQDSNVGEPVKEFAGRIVSAGVEDTIVLGAAASLVAGIGIDRQVTTRAQDFQGGAIRDLLEDCRAGGESCGGSSGVNPQVGFFYSVPTGLVRVTLARKTRMPSLKDRYSYRFGTAVPNPDLKAERNLTLEAGYQGTLGSMTAFHASAFYSRIDDLIQRFVLAPNLSQLRNIGEASHAGFEFDVRSQAVRRFDLGATYTFLDRTNLSDPDVPRIDAPRHKGRVSATAEILPSLRLLAAVDLEAGRRTQNEGGTLFSVPSFATVGVKGVWSIVRQVDVELGVLNAFDAHCWVADGYPEAGRSVVSNLRWRF